MRKLILSLSIFFLACSEPSKDIKVSRDRSPLPYKSITEDCPAQQLAYVSEKLGAEYLYQSPEEFFAAIFKMDKEFFVQMPNCTSEQ